MRAILLFLAALIAAPLAHAQTRDWRQTVTMTPEGAYAIGNPQAKVTLVEYLSYTCPHCAHFMQESKAELIDGLVRKGSVRVELRHAVRDPLDLAAALLARCAGPKGFLPASEAIFAAQSDWAAKGFEFQQENAQRLQRYPADDRNRMVIDASGLPAMAQTLGLTKAQADACLADKTQALKLADMAQKSWSQIEGTPAFLVNGQKAETTSWVALKPKLSAAGAK